MPKKLIQPSKTRQKSFTYCPQIQDRFIPNRRNTIGDEYHLKPNFKLPTDFLEEKTEDEEQEF